MRLHASEKSIPTVLTDLVSQLATLVRKEGQLARAEMSEKISQIGAGVGLIVGGAVLLMPALVVLLNAAVLALQEQGGMQPWLAALVVGGAVLLVGLILLFVGMNRVKAENLVPNKTIHQFQQDVSVAKHQVRPDHEHQRAA